MKTINLTLTRNNSGTNTFTFLDEELSQELFTKYFALNESYSVDVRDEMATFKINSSNGNNDYDFVSSSIA